MNLQTELDKFYSVCGYYPNLEKPLTFCEKLTYKKIYSPDPQEALWADKIKVREFIDKRYLHGAYHSYTPDFVVDRPCILKMNNSSGRNILVDSSLKFDRNLIEDWFSKPYGVSNYEWDAIYKYIKPGILIETELLPFPHYVYRYWCFKGEVAFIQVYKDSIENGKLVNEEITTYNTHWTKLPFKFKGKVNPDCPEPLRLVFMNALAHELSAPFPFVRADFYNIEGRISFGELTFYPQSCKIFMPRELDLSLGEMLSI